MSQSDELSELLDDSIIAEYLEQNPQFFHHHPRLLATLNLPAAQDGTVSLVTRQASIMRQKIAALEDEITSLMTMAAQNQQLYLKFSKLFYSLLNCDDINSLSNSLRDYLNQELALDDTQLILFSDNAPSPQKRQPYENIMVQRFGRSDHYFGRINQQEQQLLFGQQTEGSIALIGLGKHGQLGLLAIASHDAHHFQPEMDNLMLMQLCRLISSLINRLLAP